ncbi:MAG: hypothetical protein AB7I59_01725 [Geminicoccaceae bacterium]
MHSTRYRVWMYSRPAMCREHYRGKVDVVTDDQEQATLRAKAQAARVHGHHDWVIERIETRDR